MHLCNSVGTVSYKVFIEVRVGFWALADQAKSLTVQFTSKRFVLAMLEEQRQHLSIELFRIYDFK